MFLEKDVLKICSKFTREYPCRSELQSNFIEIALWLAIYKTKNTGMGNGMRGIRGTRGMFTSIPGNLLEDSGECYYFNIPGNVPEVSGECSKRFRGMFKKIPGHVRRDSGESSRRFRRMFERIPGNTQEDFGESKFRFILWNLAYFLSNSAIKLRKNKGIFSALLITTYN